MVFTVKTILLSTHRSVQVLAGSPHVSEVVPYTNSRLLNTSVWSTVISRCSLCSHSCIKTREPLPCKSAKTLTAKQAQPPYGNETDYITKHLNTDPAINK